MSLKSLAIVSALLYSLTITTFENIFCTRFSSLLSAVGFNLTNSIILLTSFEAGGKFASFLATKLIVSRGYMLITPPFIYLFISRTC